MSREKGYFFLGLSEGPREIRLEKEKLEKLTRTAQRIREELDFQFHMHGETEPTPPEKIAEECYLAGWMQGEIDGIEKTLKALGLYDKYQEESRKIDAKRREKREERRVRKILRKREAPALLANMEREL